MYSYFAGLLSLLRLHYLILAVIAEELFLLVLDLIHLAHLGLVQGYIRMDHPGMADVTFRFQLAVLTVCRI